LVRPHAVATVTHAERPSLIVKTAPSNIVVRLTTDGRLLDDTDGAHHSEPTLPGRVAARSIIH
jgi:hypothetical protein